MPALPAPDGGCLAGGEPSLSRGGGASVALRFCERSIERSLLVGSCSDSSPAWLHSDSNACCNALHMCLHIGTNHLTASSTRSIGCDRRGAVLGPDDWCVHRCTLHANYTNRSLPALVQMQMWGEAYGMGLLGRKDARQTDHTRRTSRSTSAVDLYDTVPQPLVLPGSSRPCLAPFMGSGGCWHTLESLQARPHDPRGP